nr:hypothetical protein [uncultured Actinoplanes sp.]
MTTLIGAEMLLWSDLDATHGPAPAGGAALRCLLPAVSGRTLVAGPHAADLLDALAAACPELTVLVRGVPDASSLTARYAGHPGVTVLCGSLEKLAAVPAYDTVVALDGLDRLVSAESEDLSWGETLALLAGVLRPSGRLLLAVENMFGLHRLVSLPASPADTDWVVAGEHDPSRPASPSRLRSHLASAGLSMVHDHAAYPGVLAGRAFLDDPGLGGFLAATLSTAVTATTDVLTDPRRLVTGALRSGLAADLAPAWIVLAGKGSAGEPSWPDAVIASASGDVREIRLPAPDLPRGRTLEDLLLAACQRRDLPSVRELLTAWLAGPAAGVPAGQVIVGPCGDHTALAAAVDPRLALRLFAAEVIRGGHAGLWPAPTTEPELTALLAGMTGRELDPADVPARPAPSAHDVRSLTVERDRLAKELAEARAKHEWYESMLRSREAELKRVRQVNKVLRATMPGRAATTLYGGLRAGRRAVRNAVRNAKGQDS